MKPKWMRNHFACPECGLVYDDTFSVEYEGKLHFLPKKSSEAFDCPRCKAHFTYSDFMEEHHNKFARGMNEEMYL